MSRTGGITGVLAAVLAALVFAPAAFASSYQSGSTVVTPSQVCPFYPGGSQLANAGYSTLSYLGDPNPVTNQVYYIALDYDSNSYTQVAGTYDCDANETVSMEIGLPEHTALAISGADPIVCSDSDAGQFTTNCPTAAETGTGSDGVKTDTGYYRFDPDNGNLLWKVDTGDTLQVAIPVRSTSAFAASSLDEDCSTTGSVCGAALTREWDGNCSGCEPAAPVEVGITVDQGATPSVGYQSPATSDLTDSGVTFNYTVTPNGISGNANADYVALAGGTTCATNTNNILTPASPTQSFAAGSTGTDYVSESATELSPGTTYCWRASYTPNQGGGTQVNGGWNQFATPAGATAATISYPTPSNTTPAVDGSDASATFYYDITPNGNTGTAYIEYQQAGAGSTCPSGSTIEESSGTPISGSGTLSESTTINTLPQGETLCWQVTFDESPSGYLLNGGWNIITTPQSSAPNPTVSYPSPSTTNVTFTNATFDWNVSSSGEAGNTYVEYGPAGSGGTCPGSSTEQTGSTAIASGTSGTSAETATASDLSAATTYCWRADFAPSAGSVVYGAWNTFGTTYLHQLPTIGYQRPATSVSATSVTVNYTMHPAGDTLTSWVDEGLPSGGSCSSPTDVTQSDTVDYSPPDGVAVNESGTISGLDVGTSYCVAASFKQGSTVHALSYELVKTNLVLFHLGGTVTYASPATTAITASGATFNYDADPNLNAGSSSVQVGADSSGGHCTSPSGVRSAGSPVAFFSGGSGSHPETATATGLSSLTAYCWRAVWTPTSGSPTDGTWQPFTTAAGVGPSGKKQAFTISHVPGSVHGDSFSVRLVIGDADSAVGIVCELKGKGKHKLLASTSVRASKVKAGAITVHVTLSRKGRTLLTKDRKLTVEIVITVRPPGGEPSTAVRTVRLAAPKKKHHKH
jgi:hypothetical protein